MVRTLMEVPPQAWVALVLMGGAVLLVLRCVRNALRSGTHPSPSYEIVGHLATGDLTNVEVALRDEETVVLKLPRIPGENDLLKKEITLLRKLHRKAAGTKYGVYLPKPVDSFEMEGNRINAFEWQAGLHAATAIHDRYPKGVDGRHVGWMFNRVLEVLGFVHKRGWIHGAVLPPHLLYHTETHGLKLVGWIHAEKFNTPLQFVPKEYTLWYPPESVEKQGVTPSVDLYLAARTMIYLAGGNPLGDVMPKNIPSELARFIRSCLLESPRMRPQDAWTLHEEFRDVLESVYGPPQFTPLAMG